MSKKAIWIAIVVVGAVGLYFAIAGRKKSEPKYRTAAVDRGPITQTVTASGTLSAVTTVQVGSQVSGIISKLHADFNSAVKKGDPLAELDPTPFQAQVEQQRAAVVKAQVDLLNDEISLTRQKRLLDEGLAAQSDYDSAKAANDGAARSAWSRRRPRSTQAETNLKYTQIISPIDGVVVARAVRRRADGRRLVSGAHALHDRSGSDQDAGLGGRLGVGHRAGQGRRSRCDSTSTPIPSASSGDRSRRSA